VASSVSKLVCAIARVPSGRAHALVRGRWVPTSRAAGRSFCSSATRVASVASAPAGMGSPARARRARPGVEEEPHGAVRGADELGAVHDEAAAGSSARDAEAEGEEGLAALVRGRAGLRAARGLAFVAADGDAEAHAIGEQRRDLHLRAELLGLEREDAREPRGRRLRAFVGGPRDVLAGEDGGLRIALHDHGELVEPGVAEAIDGHRHRAGGEGGGVGAVGLGGAGVREAEGRGGGAEVERGGAAREGEAGAQGGGVRGGGEGVDEVAGGGAAEGGAAGDGRGVRGGEGGRRDRRRRRVCTGSSARCGGARRGSGVRCEGVGGLGDREEGVALGAVGPRAEGRASVGPHRERGRAGDEGREEAAFTEEAEGLLRGRRAKGEGGDHALSLGAARQAAGSARAGRGLRRDEAGEDAEVEAAGVDGDEVNNAVGIVRVGANNRFEERGRGDLLIGALDRGRDVPEALAVEGLGVRGGEGRGGPAALDRVVGGDAEAGGGRRLRRRPRGRGGTIRGPRRGRGPRARGRGRARRGR
jgi:hypothetical protein